MTDEELREKMFEEVKKCRDLCRTCDFWDKHGHYCFGEDVKYCASVFSILALIECKVSGEPPLINTDTLTGNKSLEISLAAIAQAQRDSDMKWFKEQK